MDFEIPPDVIAKGPEAVADFERGAWWMVRIIAPRPDRKGVRTGWPVHPARRG